MGWGRVEEGGDEEVVLGVWEWGEDVFGESFRVARWVFCLAFFRKWVVLMFDGVAEMKLVVAAIYTNFRTEVVDGEGMEQVDSYVAGPVGGKCVLRFKRV